MVPAGATQNPITSNQSALANTERHFRHFWLVFVVVAVTVTFVTAGARRTPADPVELLRLEGTDRLRNFDTSSTLRVATFNIHAGVGQDGVQNLDRTAASLADVDLAALQEVRNPFLGFRGPQAAVVAEKLQMAWMFVPAERQWWHNHYGSAILTRAQLNDCVRIPFPTSSRQRFRTGLLANVRVHGRVVNVLCVHLDRDVENNTHDLQLRTAIALFLSLREPAILLGDLNEVASHPEMARLLRTPGVQSSLATVPRRDAAKIQIDWIITRGLRTVRAEWKETNASDHPVAWAELQLPEGMLGSTRPADWTVTSQN